MQIIWGEYATKRDDPPPMRVCVFRQDRVEKAGPLGRPVIEAANPNLEVCHPHGAVVPNMSSGQLIFYNELFLKPRQ